MIENRNRNGLLNDLTWDVTQEPVLVGGLPVENFQAIVRTDTGEVLNIPKKSYEPTSNTRLVEIVNELSNITGFDISGYDVFGNGGKVLGYLQNNEEVKVCGFPMKDYMVIGNSHDYSGGFFIGTVSYLLRCENQFGRINKEMKVSHTKSSHRRIDEIISYFEHYKESRNKYLEKMERYSDINIDEPAIETLIDKLLQVNNGEDISTRKANIRVDVRDSVIRETKDIGNTLFGFINGVTHYTTHIKNQKNNVFGNLFGSKAVINNKAIQICDEILKTREKVSILVN